MARARVLHWPSTWWPLSWSEKARLEAQEIAQQGELKVRGVYQHTGYTRLLVMKPSATTGWHVNIRPAHWGTRESYRIFEFDSVRYIEFEYVPDGVSDRHHWDPSRYLRIKSVR